LGFRTVRWTRRFQFQSTQNHGVDHVEEVIQEVGLEVQDRAVSVEVQRVP
jgi:hypothetical protein